MTKKKGRFLDAEAWLGGPPKPGHPKWQDQRFARSMKGRLQAQLDALAHVGIGNRVIDDTDAVNWIIEQLGKSTNEKGIEPLAGEAIKTGLATETTSEYSTVKRLARKVRKKLRDTSSAQ